MLCYRILESCTSRLRLAPPSARAEIRRSRVLRPESLLFSGGRRERLFGTDKGAWRAVEQLHEVEKDRLLMRKWQHGANFRSRLSRFRSHDVPRMIRNSRWKQGTDKDQSPRTAYGALRVVGMFPTTNGNVFLTYVFSIRYVGRGGGDRNY